MANSYYSDTALSRHSRGRSPDINAERVAVEAGFDKLPDPDPLNQGRVTYKADTGAADAYVVTLDKVPSSYVAGLSITMKAVNANTGACTLNANSLGVRSVKRTDGTDPAAGDIPAGGVIQVVYDGTNFVIMNTTSADVTAAAASASAASTSETNAAASETAAAASAAAASTSEANAGTSEANAAASASAASTSETNAGTSEANAAASASAASTSETNAGTSETNAAASASAASTSATNAAASEANAGTSEANAASSEAAAAASAVASAASAAEALAYAGNNPVVAKSGAYTVIAGDKQTVLRCTAALTLTLTAATTLGDGFAFYVIADGGDVTIDPDGAETIDGSATLTVSDGNSAKVFCDGTNWQAKVSLGAVDLTSDVTGTLPIGNLPEATTAQILSKTADKLVTPDQLFGAAPHVALTDGATVTFDMDAAINGSVTLAGDRTLTFTNIQEGQGGLIKVTQDGTGSRTLAGDATVETDSNGFPDLTTTASAVDFLTYYAHTSSLVLVAAYKLDVS